MAGGIVVASPAQAHVYEAVPIGGNPPVKVRWRDGPMLREPGGARRRAPIVFRDRGAGHGASRTGATQMAASAPDAPDSVSSNAQSGRRGRSSCAIIRCGEGAHNQVAAGDGARHWSKQGRWGEGFLLEYREFAGSPCAARRSEFGAIDGTPGARPAEGQRL